MTAPCQPDREALERKQEPRGCCAYAEKQQEPRIQPLIGARAQTIMLSSSLQTQFHAILYRLTRELRGHRTYTKEALTSITVVVQIVVQTVAPMNPASVALTGERVSHTSKLCVAAQTGSKLAAKSWSNSLDTIPVLHVTGSHGVAAATLAAPAEPARNPEPGGFGHSRVRSEQDSGKSSQFSSTHQSS